MDSFVSKAILDGVLGITLLPEFGFNYQFIALLIAVEADRSESLGESDFFFNHIVCFGSVFENTGVESEQHRVGV